MSLSYRAYEGMKKTAGQEEMAVSLNIHRTWKLLVSHLSFPWPHGALRYVCVPGQKAPGPLNFTPTFLTLNQFTCVAAELRGVFSNSFLSQRSSFTLITYLSLPASVSPKTVN